MDKRIRYAAIVGVALMALGMALRQFANNEGLQILLFFPTPVVVGIIARGVRRGFLVGLPLTYLYAIVNTLVFDPNAFRGLAGGVSVVLTFLVLNLIIAVLGGGLAAVGGLIGRLVFRQKPSPQPQG